MEDPVASLVEMFGARNIFRNLTASMRAAQEGVGGWLRGPATWGQRQNLRNVFNHRSMKSNQAKCFKRSLRGFPKSIISIYLLQFGCEALIQCAFLRRSPSSPRLAARTAADQGFARKDTERVSGSLGLRVLCRKGMQHADG